jgi:hypothetical protein
VEHGVTERENTTVSAERPVADASLGMTAILGA